MDFQNEGSKILFFKNTNVPDPKLIISDPDPQKLKIKNFGSGSWIRILLRTSDGEKKVYNFG